MGGRTRYDAASFEDFYPNDPCTRLMAVEFMWKSAGSPSAARASFSDVASSAVDWAVSEGVTTAFSGTQFSPNETCARTRLQPSFTAALPKPVCRTDRCTSDTLKRSGSISDGVTSSSEDRPFGSILVLTCSVSKCFTKGLSPIALMAGLMTKSGLSFYHYFADR